MNDELGGLLNWSSPPCEVVDVRAHVLRGGMNLADLDGATETLLVEVEDAEGRVGIGEADTASDAARAIVLMDDVHLLCRGLRNTLLGCDPIELRSNWHRLADATFLAGPSGVARHAIAAVDVALHDLAGKQLGRPVYQLLGGALRRAITPYATCYAGTVGERSLHEMLDATCVLLDRARSLGFRAIKMEVLFEGVARDRDIVVCVREGRLTVGDDVELLVDFGYRWSDWRDAAWTLRELEDCRIYLAEATLAHDDLASHAKLAATASTRIGGGEFASTWHECLAWLELGRVDVVQADVSRAGGLTEMQRIAQSALERGASVVPHCWKTGINAAAARHLQVASANVPFVEMLVPALWSSPLRDELVTPEPELENGHIALPSLPGLGVELSRDALREYAVPLSE
jgi:L-alanine-DL-glutamate epimerase-like enolase superfamily enzyme